MANASQTPDVTGGLQPPIDPAAGTIRSDLVAQCQRARAASRILASAPTGKKNKALDAIAKLLRDADKTGPILAANEKDIRAARDGGLAENLVDRLLLDDKRLGAIADAVSEIAAMEDPVGREVRAETRPNGLRVTQQTVPLGVIAMIYESRPNVTVDAAALCLKSGNAALLRGGKEARFSNAALGDIVREGLFKAGLPRDAVTALPPLSRDDTRVLLSLSEFVDLVIPRGGEGLIRFVAEHARMPVIQHYKGVCHLFVDASADLNEALPLIENSKLQRTSVCNSLECLIVHRDVAESLIPALQPLIDKGLEIRADEEGRRLLPTARAAVETDFGFEFLAPILALRVVGSLDEALEHIAQYGSFHTEAIVTKSAENQARFVREVDASCVVVNASTRFNDGGQLGLGAEIGISTTKLHAYGPMGLESLTTKKWVVFGDGHVRP